MVVLYPSTPVSAVIVRRWLMVLCGLTLAGPVWADDAALQGPCKKRAGVTVLVSPARPAPKQPLRVMVVSERPQPGARLVGRGPSGPLDLSAKAAAGGGPPHWWFARVEQPAAGRYRFALARGEVALACATARVRRRTEDAQQPAAGGPTWPVRRSWSRETENLYSAWIEKLFDAPVNERPTWRPLHQVVRDPDRNALYNHLGADEDGPDARRAVVMQPDCADQPYALRSYFAWKLRLPFGYRQCSRGTSRRPPRCAEIRSNLGIPAAKEAPADRYSFFLRRHVSYVHSGAGQTGPDDDETDLYPIKLSRDSIRPGAVYVDPSGHLLVVAKWVPQTGRRSGQLFLIESQPDLTVGRKRFWRGAFQFIADTRSGGGGFKAFRPLRVEGDQVVALTNAEIEKHKGYGNYSKEQYRLGEDGFYDRIDRLINPDPLSPLEAYREILVAMFELIQKRRDSVASGEDYIKQGSAREIAMPEGARIFQTKGPWEDYSTPARDFRLLVAIDYVLGFPKKVAAEPKRFALPKGKDPAQVQRELERLYTDFARDKSISYARSDGSSWTLTMAEVVQRREGLEMAYNPNDCVEIRWAARDPKELATCKRHAPAAQRKRMEQYREWFAKRKRPSLR